MAVQSPGDRLDRLEQVVNIIADDQLSLQKLIAELATETRRGFDQVAAQFHETDARLDKLTRETDTRLAKLTRETDTRLDKLTRETDARIRETDARIRETDARIEKVSRESNERTRFLDERVDRLVLAIGELIRRQDSSTKQ